MPCLEKLFFPLDSAHMDRPRSKNQQHGTTLDRELDEVAVKRSRLEQFKGMEPSSQVSRCLRLTYI
jgi:hypothetical protein